jgi:hypothetical protein
MYSVTVIPAENNMCQLRIDEIVDDIVPYLDEISAIQLNDIETAWFNSYACI